MVQVRVKKMVNYAEGGSDSDSDVEVPKSALKGRAKSPAAKASPKARPMQPASRKRRAPAADDGEGAAAVEGQSSALLEVVKKHGTALSVEAKEWVHRYKEDRTRATAELLTFLIQACGSEHVIGEEEVDELEVDQLKEDLSQKAQEEGLDDPFSGPKAKAKEARAFRGNYLELWDKITREAHQADVLYDQYMLDKVINLLIALNTSVVREFRRCATLTAVQLVSSFTYVTRLLEEARGTAERQLAVEERKKGGKGGSERVAAFKRTVDRAHLRINELSSYADSIFQAICQHRFRDGAEDIRASVIEGIGRWIRAHPADYLSDQYLKYIAWALSDKDASVRERAVSALLALYGARENLNPLHDFTERFSARFSELIYDKDEGVAVKGVQLLTLLVHVDQIPASSVKEVYTLLGDDSASIRHAVAELVAGMLEEQGEKALKQAPPGGRSAGKGRGRRTSGGGGSEAHTQPELQLAGLLHLMHLLANEEGLAAGEGAEEARPLGQDVSAQVVDALFHKVPVLSNWAVLAEWLKGTKAVEHFGEAGLTNLAQVLYQALVKATGGQLIEGAHEYKKGKPKERAEAAAAARQEATLVLMKELPSLLKKLQTQPEQAAAVVSLLPELKLEIYSLKRQDKGFAALAGTVKDIFFKHDDTQVSQQCIRALAGCVDEGSDAVKDAAQLRLRQCAEDAAEQLKSAVEQLEGLDPMELNTAVEALQEGAGAEEGEEEHEALYSVRVALGRLLAVQMFDGGAEGLGPAYEALNQLVQALASGQALPRAIASGALSNTLLLLMWQLRALDPERPDKGALKAVAARRAGFVRQLEAILEGELELETKAEACQALSDVCLMFSAVHLRGSPLEPAGFAPSDALLDAMWRQWEAIITVPVLEDDEEAAARQGERKAVAASKVAQLILFKAIPQASTLAARLVSYYVGAGPEVTEVVKDTCRQLKKEAPGRMAALYLEAMKAAYGRAEAALGEEEDDEGALDQLVALSHRIAASYAGFNASAAALGHIVGQGALWTLGGAPGRLPFLQGVACFLSRLPSRDAQAALQQVQAAAQSVPGLPAAAGEAQYPWDLYHDFVQLLEDRVAKGVPPKSALKRSTAAGDKPGPRTRISLYRRGGAEEEEEDRENLEPADNIMAQDDEEPALRAVQQRGPGRGEAAGAAADLGRGDSQQSEDLLASQHRGSTRAAPAEEGSEEEEESEEEQEEDEEMAGEGEDEDEDGEGVALPLPTEEQLPGAAQQAQQPTRRRGARQSVFADAAEEEEEEEEEGGSEEDRDDEELPDITRRPAKIDALVQQQQQQQQGEEEEDAGEEEDNAASQAARKMRALRKRRH